VDSNLFDLTGRVSVVTGAGAGGGLGHAIALGLAWHGADVVSADIDEEGATITAQEIKAMGRKSIAAYCDTSDSDDVASLFAQVDQTFGRLDILVNNAGVTSHGHPEELSLEEWNRVMGINATGYFLCAQQAIRRMLEQGKGGSIINVSSVASQAALGRGNLAYSVSKSAVNQMTRELAVEFAGKGIRVNAILPTHVLTPILQSIIDDPQFDSSKLMACWLKGIPINRLLEPDDVVGAVVFLASSAATAITGVLLPVDGGNLALSSTGSTVWPSEA
jgi:NAD(P)-dependent dehydrogenase (short-subunit alcohol dehydrogenase family)